MVFPDDGLGKFSSSHLLPRTYMRTTPVAHLESTVEAGKPTEQEQTEVGFLFYQAAPIPGAG